MLHGSEDDAHLLLLVLTDEIDALVVVGNGHNLYLRSIGRHLDIAEERLDLAFDVVDVDVANDDDGLVVGTIPLAIVGAQRLRRAAVDDAHQTNGEALAIERTGIELRQQSLKDFLQADDAHAILVVHDVALGIDGFLGERDAVRPVFQNHHAGVDGRLACRGHIGEEVDRLVGGGVCVQVATILHADALQILLQEVVLEVVGTVEGHVLQQVGETALALLFLHRAHLLGDVVVGYFLGIVVVADVVGESVVELTHAHVLILRQCHVLC